MTQGGQVRQAAGAAGGGKWAAAAPALAETMVGQRWLSGPRGGAAHGWEGHRAAGAVRGRWWRKARGAGRSLSLPLSLSLSPSLSLSLPFSLSLPLSLPRATRTTARGARAVDYFKADEAGGLRYGIFMARERGLWSGRPPD